MEILIDKNTFKKYFSEVEHLVNMLLGIMGHDGLAITRRKSSTTVHQQEMNEMTTAVDYTIEIHVELSEKAKCKALDVDIPLKKIRSECGNFFCEAKTLRKIIKSKLPFGIKVLCVSYMPPSK